MLVYLKLFLTCQILLVVVVFVLCFVCLNDGHFLLGSISSWSYLEERGVEQSRVGVEVKVQRMWTEWMNGDDDDAKGICPFIEVYLSEKVPKADTGCYLLLSQVIVGGEFLSGNHGEVMEALISHVSVQMC